MRVVSDNSIKKEWEKGCALLSSFSPWEELNTVATETW